MAGAASGGIEPPLGGVATDRWSGAGTPIRRTLAAQAGGAGGGRCMMMGAVALQPVLGVEMAVLPIHRRAATGARGASALPRARAITPPPGDTP